MVGPTAPARSRLHGPALPQRRRTLVRALFADDDVRYADISQALDLPPGSIGPTRGRVLRTLRRSLEHVGLDAESA